MTVTLVEVALAGILALAPRLDPVRAQSLAEAHAYAAEMADGDGDPRANVITAGVIGWHEGWVYNLKVERCIITAAGGRTVSLYGLMSPWGWWGHTREELCAGGPLPAYLSITHFNGVLSACKRFGFIGAWRAYASGKCTQRSQAATDMCRKWVRLLNTSGVDVPGTGTCEDAPPRKKMKRKPRKQKRT